MKNLRATVAAAVVACGAVGGAQAGTVEVVFDLTGNLGLKDSLTFSRGGVDLTVTGHLLNSDGSVGSQERVGQYSNGLGVTNDNEYKTIKKPEDCKWTRSGMKCDWVEHTIFTDAHFVDGKGENEVLKFAFDQAVEIHTVWFSYNDRKEDFAFTVLDGVKSGSFFPEIDIPGKNFYSSYTFSKQWIATMFGIGAVGKDDEFKVKKIKVSYHEPEEPEVIPLPAAGWLLLGGLGGLAAIKRRRKAA